MVSLVTIGVVGGGGIAAEIGERRERGGETFFDVPAVRTPRSGWTTGIVVEGVLVCGHFVLEKVFEGEVGLGIWREGRECCEVEVGEKQYYIMFVRHVTRKLSSLSACQRYCQLSSIALSISVLKIQRTYATWNSTAITGH